VNQEPQRFEIVGTSSSLRLTCARLVDWCEGQASVNPKAETVEDLLARRKNLHMGMLKLAREDLALKLQAALDVFVVLALSFTAKQQFEHYCIES
jgi:hypothetical protein